MYKFTKQYGYKNGDKIKFASFRVECYEAISTAKERYLHLMGRDLAHLFAGKFCTES